jgi:hypothetical protein
MQSQLIKERIESFLNEEKRINRELMNEITLLLFCSEFPDSDLYFLAKRFDDNTLFELISYADGEPIRLPSKEDFRNNYLVAICFLMKEKLGMSWGEIKEVLNLPEKDQKLISSITIGKKIKKIKEKFNADTNRLLSKIIINDIRDLKKEKEDIDERYSRQE